MADLFIKWLSGHYIEVSGAILGIAYIFFSIRQHILTWPTGLLTSILYVIVFFQSKFYADMGLQAYYVVISIYGWYYWLKGGKRNTEKNIKVKKTDPKLFWYLLAASILTYLIILYILLNYTDSPLPYMDSMTTALSIVATWMLARKYIEHWIIWVFVDLFSAGLYIYKGLWATTILFVVYTVMAIIGYFEWRKSLVSYDE